MGMTSRRPKVTLARRYGVLTVEQAREVATGWLMQANLQNAVVFGLPEVDDRYHIWRVPLKGKANGERIGEVVIDAHTSLVLEERSTRFDTIEERLLGRTEKRVASRSGSRQKHVVSSLRNTRIISLTTNTCSRCAR